MLWLVPAKTAFSAYFPQTGAPQYASKHKLGGAFVEWIQPTKKVLKKAHESAAGPFVRGYFYINLPNTLITFDPTEMAKGGTFWHPTLVDDKVC